MMHPSFFKAVLLGCLCMLLAFSSAAPAKRSTERTVHARSNSVSLDTVIADMRMHTAQARRRSTSDLATIDDNDQVEELLTSLKREARETRAYVNGVYIYRSFWNYGLNPKLCPTESLRISVNGYFFDVDYFNVTVLKDFTIHSSNLFAPRPENDWYPLEWTTPAIGPSANYDRRIMINVIVSGRTVNGTTFVACAAADFYELDPIADSVAFLTEDFQAGGASKFFGNGWTTTYGVPAVNNGTGNSTGPFDNIAATDSYNWIQQIMTHWEKPLYLPTLESGNVLKLEFYYRYLENRASDTLTALFSPFCEEANSSNAIIVWEKSRWDLNTAAGLNSWRKASVKLNYSDPFTGDFVSNYRTVRLRFQWYSTNSTSNTIFVDDIFVGAAPAFENDTTVPDDNNTNTNNTDTCNPNPSCTGLSLPVGSIIAWMGTSNMVPAGWLICNGSFYDTGRYPALAALLGSNALPDLRGRFLLSQVDPMGPGSTGGSSTASLNVGNLPPHEHSIGMALDGTFTGGNLQLGSNPQTFHLEGSGPYGRVGGGFTSTVGSGAPFSVMNPYFVVNHIIKAE